MNINITLMFGDKELSSKFNPMVDDEDLFRKIKSKAKKRKPRNTNEMFISSDEISETPKKKMGEIQRKYKPEK